MAQEHITIKQFDLVGIKTTKRVTYLSAPPGSAVDPAKEWSVIGAVGPDLLITDGTAVVRIPPEDVLLKAAYSLQKFTNRLGRLTADVNEQPEANNQEAKREEG